MQPLVRSIASAASGEERRVAFAADELASMPRQDHLWY